MQCPACGTQLPDQAKFCGACGHQFTGGGGGAIAATGGAVQSIDQIIAGPVEVPPVGDLLTQSWEQTKPSVVPMAVGSFLSLLVVSVMGAIPLGSFLTGPLYPGGLALVGLRAADGKPTEIAHFFGGFKKFVPLLLANLIIFLAFFVGLILLVVPGFYVLMATVYANFLIIDRDMEFMDALKGSVAVINKSLVPHLVLFLVLGVVNFVGAIPCGLGMLVTLPLSFVAIGLVYKRIFGIAGGADQLI